MSRESRARDIESTGEAARAAFERAISGEIDAIAPLESAALRHEQVAAHLDQDALNARDEVLRDAALEHAAGVELAWPANTV